MIHYNVQHGKTTVKVGVEFGKGTVLVNYAGDSDSGMLLLKSSERAGEIGEFTSEKTKGMSSDEYNPDIIMKFDNPQSIDVVIEALTEIRKLIERND